MALRALGAHWSITMSEGYNLLSKSGIEETRYILAERRNFILLLRSLVYVLNFSVLSSLMFNSLARLIELTWTMWKFFT